MSESTPPRSPEPGEPRTPAASAADHQPTAPQPQQAPGPFPEAPPSAATRAEGPYPQSAYSYPAGPSAGSDWRTSGKRVALLITGSVVVGLLLFGGGYLTASVVNSIPGISDGRLGNDGPRMGPGGEWPGGGERDDHGPGTRDDGSGDDSDTDDSTDTSVFLG